VGVRKREEKEIEGVGGEQLNYCYTWMNTKYGSDRQEDMNRKYTT
jgi:hypothetical protein